MAVPSAYKRTRIGGRHLLGGNALAASLTTSIAGSNNDLVYTARTRGTGGNAIRVRYVVSGTNTALSVSVSGNDVTVNSATDGAGAATSTANAVAAAVIASQASNFLVSVANAPANDGTGVIAAMAFTSLANGLSFVTGHGR